MELMREMNLQINLQGLSDVSNFHNVSTRRITAKISNLLVKLFSELQKKNICVVYRFVVKSISCSPIQMT